MFEINLILLKKMGWIDYSYNYSIIFNILNNDDINGIKHIFLSQERNMFFAIKEISHDSKLKKNKKYNEYEFIIVDFSKKRKYYYKKRLVSNIELLYLIRENLACDISYQRFFQINSILK